MKRLWLAFGTVIVVSFSILGWIGTRIYQEMPPIPDRVVTREGRVVIGSGEIGQGQNIWQTMGGMEVGSVWGHGSYVAPDWTADSLRRELEFVLGEWARTEHGKPYKELGAEQKGALRARLEQTFRANTYDPASRTLVIDEVRARAFASNAAHYTKLFAEGEPAYAIPKGAVPDAERARKLAAFFWWTAWSASTNRPGDTISYTHNWPHEPLVGNVPTGESVLWTGVSILMLLGGICAMVWWYASQPKETPMERPAADPLLPLAATPSQKATLKYFWVVALLILAQILLGVVTAHYGVEGTGSTASLSRSGCRTASRGPGTCSSGFSGSPHRGSRRGSTSVRWFQAANRSIRRWA